ncbi:cation transporter [Salinisphaera sp. T31B1]|uniref:cation transporter n=1 Tax=Salinisphaera sp. T31B1 TaxID=727963 RepID=UPI00334210DB
MTRRPEPRRPGRLPPQKRRVLTQARRQEWLVLGLRISVVIALYAALGSTQSLTAIWLKSLWALLPPIAFLTACRVERREPTPRFPYGFYRAGSIAFLTSALALSCMGLYLLYSALHGWLAGRHPSLTTIAADNVWHWPGWPILAAIAYSAAVPWFAGRARQRRAIALHDKGLFADATMGRVSWRAAAAAGLGVIGIGLGVWWADIAATVVISIDVLWHGLRHLRTATCDLIDEVPRRIGSNALDPAGRRIHDYLDSLDWVADARIRLREEGRLLTGVALICPHDTICDEPGLIERIDAARAEIEAGDWRLLDFELVPVGRRRWEAELRDR